MLAYAERCGIALDVMLNVLFGGASGQTISLRAALAASRGSRPACIVCELLSALVEKDHCRKQLLSGATPASAALRAGILLVALAAALIHLPRILIDLFM